MGMFLDNSLVCLYWMVQVDPVALISIVSFVTVITLWGIFASRKKEANYANSFSNKYYDVKADDEHQDTVGKRDAKDYKGLFEEFRRSRLYAEIVVALVTDGVIQEQNLIDMKKVLYEFFIEFRLYLHENGPKLSDTDIDYCILTLAGIKQEHINKLIGISSSEVRLIKQQMKVKLSARMYRNVFLVKHCIY